MKNIFLVALFTLIVVGCKNEDSKIIDLTNFKPTEGFVDIPLSIIETKEVDGYFEYNVGATVDKDTIGIRIKLKKNIAAGFVNGSPANVFLNDGIEFISKGNESDGLLQYMADKYEVQNNAISLKNSQIFTCANLNQEKTDYSNGESGFKIFLEEGKDYAELFVNFNFREGIISLNEKDNDYREPLIKLLGK